MNGNSTQGYQGKGNAPVSGAGGDDGLERSCRIESDLIRTAQPEAGIERIEARFRGDMFSLHRHDTYAIGVTEHGIQRFKYRGEERASLPGQVIVIHPDELHDGGAGTEAGLRYRMLYIPPEHIAAALGEDNGHKLPFLSAPVLSDFGFQKSLIDALEDLVSPMGELKLNSLLSELAQSLNRHSDDPKKQSAMIDWPALKTCAEFLRDNCAAGIGIRPLEEISGLDRFSLARQFRKAFGTSPHRYLVMRRLERAKEALSQGHSLADAAFASGFSDQAHMTRHFKKTFGMTPGHWRHLSAAGRS